MNDDEQKVRSLKDIAWWTFLMDSFRVMEYMLALHIIQYDESINFCSGQQLFLSQNCLLPTSRET